MRKTRLSIVISSFFCLGSLLTSGATREPGLWEISTTTTWQKAPVLPGADAARLHTGTRTQKVCLTQEMIDDYGALLPQSRGQCQIQNRVLKAGRVTGQYVCSGMMDGRGELESVWTDTEHASGKVHFVGTMQVGAERQPVEWTTESKSVFQGSNCGNVKPQQLNGRTH